MKGISFIAVLGLLLLSGVAAAEESSSDIKLDTFMGESSISDALAPISKQTGFLISIALVIFFLSTVVALFGGAILSNAGGAAKRIELRTHGASSIYNAIFVGVIVSLSVTFIFYYFNKFLL